MPDTTTVALLVLFIQSVISSPPNHPNLILPQLPQSKEAFHPPYHTASLTRGPGKVRCSCPLREVQSASCENAWEKIRRNEDNFEFRHRFLNYKANTVYAKLQIALGCPENTKLNPGAIAEGYHCGPLAMMDRVL